jgi:hypothetical protein
MASADKRSHRMFQPEVIVEDFTAGNGVAGMESRDPLGASPTVIDLAYGPGHLRHRECARRR